MNRSAWAKLQNVSGNRGEMRRMFTGWVPIGRERATASSRSSGQRRSIENYERSPVRVERDEENAVRREGQQGVEDETRWNRCPGPARTLRHLSRRATCEESRIGFRARLALA